jgi:hypothetical protein
MPAVAPSWRKRRNSILIIIRTQTITENQTGTSRESWASSSRVHLDTLPPLSCGRERGVYAASPPEAHSSIVRLCHSELKRPEGRAPIAVSRCAHIAAFESKNASIQNPTDKDDARYRPVTSATAFWTISKSLVPRKPLKPTDNLVWPSTMIGCPPSQPMKSGRLMPKSCSSILPA